MAADIKALESNPLVQGAVKNALSSQATIPAPIPRNGVAAQEAPSSSSREAVERLAQRLRDYAQSMDREVQFSVDEASGYTVIKVIDPESQKVIRQIPAEVTLRLARHLESGSQGLLFTDEA